MSIFTHVSDSATDRWESGGHEYAVGPDPDPICPAGDFRSGKNAARRVGNSPYYGDSTVPEAPGAVRATTTYGDSQFEAWAYDQDEANDLVTMFAHWAEGDVYAIERDGYTVHGYYTDDGLPPSQSQAEQAF